MNMTSLSGRLADVALIVFFGLLLWSHPQLPDQVVSHFGANGPDGWMAKNTFVWLFGGTVLGFEALFRWWLPTRMRRTPRRVNMPYKSYWMATPERQKEACEKVIGILPPSRLFFNGAMLVALHACVQASGVPVLIEAPLQLLGFGIGVGTLVYSAAIVVWAFRAFKPPVERRI